MATLSRRKLANYVTARLIHGDDISTVMNELAGYLIESRRTKESQLTIRDIETMLSKRGTVLADVTSARALTTGAKADIVSYVQQAYKHEVTVLLREIIDESVIGGVKIALPDRQLDATVQAKLDRLTRK